MFYVSMAVGRHFIIEARKSSVPFNVYWRGLWSVCLRLAPLLSVFIDGKSFVFEIRPLREVWFQGFDVKPASLVAESCDFWVLKS